ncbi:MAG: LysR family transcriptional regulator [Flavobacteriaceae bacterium]|jgi:DNA-binding transcriptional LysR family regulator|uniref:LysR family transcriptional regulator n=1 Tax=Elizabethkingia ursingii TaxID=1756150 RepID=A0ABX3NFW4_9FLAO|nr:LysR family transcriptional regulator [Elizabethkingia ursingii]MDR2230945.1 LysR family transcriptional regulator [Flavobacteriaceae bacterium]KUY26618.1 LysR family transcriptional regulator [Elizabethkingia ursingii]MCL1664716.1 LysR family transcriptional regulator [Elizabethkingia ursingii]MCL1673825.1 LysR family transcriptional regulator [Elizabethkingia ursingii]OPB94696.1 LysR family transcriptional regulator [Elizabethkingia ursingii]
MRWNLEWLRTFKAIYETGTLSAAAQELFISQPGVSLHLNSLEAFTGNKLFDRLARKMVPTEKGKILYNYILDSMKKLEEGEQHFHKRTQSERVTISVGMCFETFQYTLEEHISELPFNLIIKFGEYPQMQHDLDSGMLDLIITPQKGSQQNIQYQPFSKERIVLIAGNETDTTDLEELLHEGKIKDAADLLKQQLWYSTAADMEHLKNFWLKHFGEHPDFSPNYIVPNISSIIRCLSDSKGFSVVPDFLCADVLNSGKIKMVWEGTHPVENTLYFGTRKKTMYQEEINQLEKLLKEKWEMIEEIL